MARTAYPVVFEILKNEEESDYYEDLIMEGFLGLLEAAMRFDLNKGQDFNLYAWYWTRSKIGRASKQNCLIHLPEEILDNLVKIGELQLDFNKSFIPYEKFDLALILGITQPKLNKWLEIDKWHFYSIFTFSRIFYIP